VVLGLFLWQANASIEIIAGRDLAATAEARFSMGFLISKTEQHVSVIDFAIWFANGL
jgi:hypothetical protein